MTGPQQLLKSDDRRADIKAMRNCGLTGRRRRPCRDEGFTLLEAVVALVVVLIMTLALATSVIAGVRASMASRENQQAADFMSRRIEQVRQVGFGSLGHVSSDLVPASDPRISTCGSRKCVDPGTGTQEKLFVLSSGAGIPSHVQTVTDNGTTYTVRTYVTEVAGSQPSELLRSTVFVSWTTRGKTRTRSISTLVTLAQRGLPLPRYTFTTAQASTTANPGGRLQVLSKLYNQGAPDRFNLVLSGTATAWGWVLYDDTDSSGGWSVGDTPLTDTSGDGIVDTGRLDPTVQLNILAVYDSSALDAAASRSLTITATSVGQPSMAGASKALTFGAVLTTGPVGPTTSSTSTTSSSSTTSTAPAVADCPWTGSVPTVTVPSGPGNGNSYTSTVYSLRNGTAGSTSDTTAQAVSNLSLTASSATSLAAMSTDVNSLPGRTVEDKSVGTDAAVLALSNAEDYADWKLSLGNQAMDVGGTAVLGLWVAPTSGSLSGISLRVVAYKGNAGSQTSINSTANVLTTVATSCSGWQRVYVSIPLTTSTVAKNTQFGVRVANVGSSPVRLAYDATVASSTTGGYQATFGLGVK